MNSLYHSLTISHITEEVPGFKTFIFAGEDANAIRYEAGQYLTLVMMENQAEVRRSYSIISSPDLGEPLAIGVKRIENGVFSRWLVDKAKVGDVVTTTGASGFFILPQELSLRQKQVMCWAAGSGITPIFSIIKTLLYAHQAVNVLLVYSNSSPEVTIYKEHLERLAQQFPDQFQLVFLYSNAQRLDEARLHKSFLKQLVRKHAAVPAADLLCYICGPENYRRLCVYGLREMDVPAEQIWQENFNSEKVTLKVLPPDTNPHRVTLWLHNEKYEVVTQYPDTILQAARKTGISLPYSCETGKCGNCAAQCLEGSVWMSYNEVLTQKALAKGLTLTCVGYPFGGDVVLKLL
ncbi:2Fe-2S iron-sulfur cluster-binding protein [Rufibacter roseus]|uniref:2Fe-2S iron-sulfur cluster-binding protein n=1 Tax=Rufibacter roseus TaxID=1567108 RepID=A0ABW2DK28_9BACT|nr:2Fe-2S iron-sulfur cluster-binding protein [Rufibacter roseus]